jgi:formylglycine-generating enzyme required for sulfatase activity
MRLPSSTRSCGPGSARRQKSSNLRAYLDEFPKGANTGAAQASIDLLEREAAEAKAVERLRAQETEAWGAVAASTDKARIEAFLTDWPNGQHAAAAKARVAELRRGVGGLRRGVLIGAGATAALAVLIFGGWLAYQRVLFLREVAPTPLSAQAEQALEPSSSFKECVSCPGLVVVSAGNFTMGSNESRDEKPPHRITLRQPFAVGKFEVTFDEWDTCVAHGGCTPKPDDRSWGRGRRPVMNVSWDDAKQYVAWIVKLTGKPYRLLTEAEWEYTARAGTTTTYSWGNDIGPGNANCSACGSQWDNQKTAPVGSFKPNELGLYDMHGNVSEWCEDVWHDNYNGAPTDGSAWLLGGDDSGRVVRGGS